MIPRTTLAALFAMLLLTAATGLAALEDKSSLPVAPRKAPVAGEGLKGATHVGPEACIDCHRDDHKAWSGTWHARMLRKISPDIVTADFNDVEITYSDVEVLDADKNKVRISPAVRLSRQGDDFLMTLVDKDDEGNNRTYRMGYVLGGNWEQQFEAEVGLVPYPTPMRWVVADQQWRAKAFSEIWWVADGTPDGRPRAPEEMQGNQTSDAKCDGCHTTGRKPVKEGDRWTLADKDAGLGISCERCHGPGSIHVAQQSRDSIINPVNLNPVQQEQLCGQCHSRVTNKKEKDLAYPLDFAPGQTDLPDRVEFWTYSTQPGNFWPNEYASKNRQQYNDSRNTPHARAGVTCATCHSAHPQQGFERSLRLSKDGTCRQCHASQVALYDQSAHDRAGIGCNECHLARIASRAGATAKAREHWDATSHTYAVVLPFEANSYKMRSSCDNCHAGNDRAGYGQAMLDGQQQVRSRFDGIQAALAKRKAGDPRAALARENLGQVLLDGSLGAHNASKAQGILDLSAELLKGQR